MNGESNISTSSQVLVFLQNFPADYPREFSVNEFREFMRINGYEYPTNGSVSGFFFRACEYGMMTRKGLRENPSGHSRIVYELIDTNIDIPVKKHSSPGGAPGRIFLASGKRAKLSKLPGPRAVLTIETLQDELLNLAGRILEMIQTPDLGKIPTANLLREITKRVKSERE